MKLQKREQLLVGAAAGIFVLVGLIAFVATGDSQSDESLRAEHDRLKGDLQKKQQLLQAAEEDSRQLADWRKRSLPREPAIAQSLYERWLRTLCDETGLQNVELKAQQTDTHRNEKKQAVYTRIPFTIRARGGLSEVVSFLHGFYSAGYLQLIRRLEIKPIADNKRAIAGTEESVFDLQFAIDAVAMQDADSTGKLPSQSESELLDLYAYQESIVDRRLFDDYVATPPPPPPPPLLEYPNFASLVYVSAFVQDQDDGSREVWLTDRTAFRKLQLKEGENFTVRAGSGQVRSIAPDDKVIVEFNGKRSELSLGDNLAGGKQL